MPTLKCLTPITTHPAIKTNGQIAIQGSISRIKSAFDAKNTDLLTALAKGFEIKGARIKGSNLSDFNMELYMKERFLFLTRWTPEKSFYFPPQFNLCAYHFLLSHHYFKKNDSDGICSFGKLPRVIVYLVISFMSISFLSDPNSIKSFEFNSSQSSSHSYSSSHKKDKGCSINWDKIKRK